MPELNEFEWIPIYEEFAEKLLDFEKDRKPLVDIIEKAYEETGIPMPQLQEGGKLTDIDPFTTFGLFNKGIKDVNRKSLLGYFKKRLDLNSDMPGSFDGIPVLMNQNATYSWWNASRKDDVDTLWSLLRTALSYKNEQSEVNKNAFIAAYDKCLSLKGTGNSKITMALYWIAPSFYLNLDSRNRWYIFESGKISEDGLGLQESERKRLMKALKSKLTCGDYLKIRDAVHDFILSEGSQFADFSHLSKEAWRYSEEVNQLLKAQEEAEAEEAFNSESPQDEQPSAQQKGSTYSKEDFLREVYASSEFYDRVVALLKRKRNIILQGPPGVGKTFMAKRLAYAMMGEKDDSRIGSIQFHQSYSYEDFVQGYKPTDEGGFKLEPGVFYKFCYKASKDPDPNKKYFFIIDEINRGNISKIFGELLMLIEESHRGPNDALPLTYDRYGKPFYVPENVYIIGMMNTADRSLALIDYALRRRFAFVSVEPAFDSGNKAFEAELHKSAYDLSKAVETIKNLNQVIVSDSSLGKGFAIGHSYLCGIRDKESLRSAIEYEIIPLIEEYWIDDERKCGEWVHTLRSICE